MVNNESLVGKWAAYGCGGNFTSGYGKIVEEDSGTIGVEEYPGGIYKTYMSVGDAQIFDTMEKASECYHKGDEQCEERRRLEVIELHSRF